MLMVVGDGDEAGRGRVCLRAFACVHTIVGGEGCNNGGSFCEGNGDGGPGTL